MDTPQSKAFWLGRNLHILYFKIALGADLKDEKLQQVQHLVNGFARSLDVRVDIPSGDLASMWGTFREAIRMDLAVVRTEFVSKCFVFGSDFSAWAVVRGGHGEGNQAGSGLDLAKVEGNLRSQAEYLGLSEELDPCIAAARDPAVSKEQFDQLVAIDMLLRMTKKLDDTPAKGPGGPRASDRLFIVMPMNPADPGLEDVLHSIGETSKKLGLEAVRVDQLAAPGRITDDIVNGLKTAAFVVVDLTNSKPNVYWEAGYVHGLGKIPIYIARAGTPLEFDIKDYPVIYFANNVKLRESLEKRLKGMMAQAAGPGAKAPAKPSRKKKGA